MWPRFQFSRDDQNSVLTLTHFLQIAFALTTGIVLILSPRSRYGDSYQFIFELQPCGDNILGAVFIVAGLSMLCALCCGRTRLMGLSLLLIGVLCWVFATFLFFGSLFGPTGVLGPIFCFYAGAHMIIQSSIYTRSVKK